MSAIRAIEQFDFHHNLEKSSGTAIVFFSSNECLSCRHWQQLLEHYCKLRPEIHVFKVDAGMDLALTEEFNVFHLPSLFVYHNGQYHAPLQCEARLELLDAAIKKVLAAPAEEAP